MNHGSSASSSPARILFPIFATLIVITLVVMLRELILFTFFSVLLALVMSYPVGWLSRKMSRGAAVILVLLVGVGSIAGTGLLTFPQITLQVHSVAQRLPNATDDMQNWIQNLHEEVTKVGVPQAQAGQITKKFGETLTAGLESFLASIVPAAKGVVVILTTLFMMIVMASFLVAQPEVYRKALRAVVARGQTDAFDEWYRRMGKALHSWLGGILISMTLMGSFTAVGLFLAGIDDWPLLGLLTFFLTFIPYLGAIASAFPGMIIALSQDPRHLLYAMAVYTCVHLCEGYLVEPLVMKRAVNIPPATLLFGETALGLLLGFPGIIVAAPLLVALQITTQYLYEERYLGKRAVVPKVA